MKRKTFSPFWTALAGAGGLLLVWSATVDLVLLAAGKQVSAVAEYSVPSWGARNRTYAVHYVLFRDGQEYRGSGAAIRAVGAGSRVPVRILTFAPSINTADSTGTLMIRGLGALAAGVCLSVVTRRRLLGGASKRTLEVH